MIWSITRWSGMINVICSVMFQIILMLLISVSCAKAQYIIEEKDSRIPVNYDLLPEGKEFENPVDEAKYFLNLPEEKLRSDESEVEETKSTMYLDADNFTMETESAEEGKVSSIFNGKQKTFYYRVSIMGYQKLKIIFYIPSNS